MRWLHTSDWQIGKSFRFADDDTLAVLQNERLEVIVRLGRLARAEGCAHVLVAGDVWDMAQPSLRTLRQPVERMRQFPDLCWHLIPGNHDPDAPGGPWERMNRDGWPSNVHAHLTPGAVRLDEEAPGAGVWLLPAPLGRRHAFGDPTAAMDGMGTPEGALRVGLAHGSIRAFGSDPATQPNLIALDRAARAGLGYLALGDWHGMRPVDARCFYSGTPEVDGFDRGGDGGGSALVVSLDGAGAVPVVVPHRVGRFSWHREDAVLTDAAGVDALERRLRALDEEDPSRVLAWLRVSGALTLGERAAFDDRIRDGVGAALRVLRLDADRLELAPADGELAEIGHSAALREAGASLAARAADPADPARDVARAALLRLHLLHKHLPAEPRTRAAGENRR
ncbi:metallophosphoesterase family protein [Rhizosaccharibacter radicis]|uniref:Metallophosphoesterase n=1 Tax=Rhizosaccharibacter radicis TaxID=2782605 RepID=A0ABT1VUI8_9PROT|nr:metallophosphoesterase [Acetobacteraceae bacterium KSS12]